jgi:pilus assembly protein CpaB
MNMKTYLPLAAALVLGTIAALVAKTTLSRGPSSQAPKAVQIVVAKAAISPGQELTADQLQLAPSSAKAPAHSFTAVSDLVGRVLTAPVLAGQPVLEEQLAPRGTTSGAQALVPTGMRAVTVDVNESGGVGGLLTPGSRVDVLLTAIAVDPSRTQAKTIVQNVRVLAVGQRLAAGVYEPSKETATRTVTLLTTAHDAEVIELASSVRPVRLVLRNNADNDDTDSEGVQLTELLGGGGAPGLMSRLLMAFQPANPAPPTPAPAPVTQPAVAPAPTTQPALATDSTPRRHRKSVRFIQGNEEARIVFEVEPQQQAGNDEQNVVP